MQARVMNKTTFAAMACPHCGSNNIEYLGNDWTCNDCERLFNADDCTRQWYWVQISCFLEGTSEDEPRIVEELLILPTYEEEACGLSSLQIPSVAKMFQVEGDGTMWYQFDGCEDWHDMSELATSDIKAIFEYLNY